MFLQDISRSGLKGSGFPGRNIIVFFFVLLCLFLTAAALRLNFFLLCLFLGLHVVLAAFFAAGGTSGVHPGAATITKQIINMLCSMYFIAALFSVTTDLSWTIAFLSFFPFFSFCTLQRLFFSSSNLKVTVLNLAPRRVSILSPSRFSY